MLNQESPGFSRGEQVNARIKVRRQWLGWLGWRAVCTGLCWWGRSAASQQGALAAGLAHLTEAHPEQAEQVRMEALRRAWVAGMDAEPLTDENRPESDAEGPGATRVPDRPQTPPRPRLQMLPDPTQPKGTTP